MNIVNNLHSLRTHIPSTVGVFIIDMFISCGVTLLAMLVAPLVAPAVI